VTFSCLAMYFSYYCISVFGLPWYFAFIVVILATAAFGVLTERVAYAPLRKQGAPPISLLTSAIGMAYLLENLATVIFSGRPKSYPDIPLLTTSVSIGGIHLSRLMLIVPVITIILLISLHFLIDKTKIGMAMRGVARDGGNCPVDGHQHRCNYHVYFRSRIRFGSCWCYFFRIEISSNSAFSWCYALDLNALLQQ